MIFKSLYVELSVGRREQDSEQDNKERIPRNMNDRVLILTQYSLAKCGSSLNSSPRYHGRDLGILVEQVLKTRITQLLRTVVR